MAEIPTNRLRRIGALVVAVLLCEGVGLIAGIATQSSVQTWYPTLTKPSFTPPGWLFAPVWIALYAMMGVAAWMVWMRGASAKRQRALGWFAVQLVLNALWSIIFFGMQAPGGGLITIVVLWGAIAVTMRDFLRLRRTAGWLLGPYLLWVTYAAALNGAIWWMN